MYFSTATLLSQLTQVTQQLRLLTQIDVQQQWQVINSMQSVEPVEVNQRGHIAWATGKEILRLRQKIIVPTELRGYPLTGLSLRLVLSWWAEDVQIYVNHQFVQAGDLFDSYTRILLSPSVQPGDEFEVELWLVSPGHDRGALVSAFCWYELSDSSQLDPVFIADELEILGIILAAEPLPPNLEPSLISLSEILAIIWLILLR